MSGPRMILACDALNTNEWLAKHFPNLRCDREAGHGGPHRTRNGPGDEDWWLGGVIGISEEVVTSMVEDAEKERAKAERAAAKEKAKTEKAAAREAKRKAKASGEMFAGEPKP